jgi:hypothetical protein
MPMKNDVFIWALIVLGGVALIGLLITANEFHKRNVEMIVRLEAQKIIPPPQQENADGKTHPTQAD